MQSVEDESDSNSDSLFIGSVNEINSVSSSEWMTEININNQSVKIQLDTGAKCNIIPLGVYNSLNIDTHS